METKLSSFLVEVVGNGFILHEDFHQADPSFVPHVKKRLVFNSVSKLNKYIRESTNI